MQTNDQNTGLVRYHYFKPTNDEKHDISVRLEELRYNHSQGKMEVSYVVKQNNIVLFAGDNFFASPLHNSIGLHSAKDLLALIAYNPERNHEYTAEQLDFCHFVENYLILD